jgi:hypothetical protein
MNNLAVRATKLDTLALYETKIVKFDEYRLKMYQNSINFIDITFKKI